MMAVDGRDYIMPLYWVEFGYQMGNGFLISSGRHTICGVFNLCEAKVKS